MKKKLLITSLSAILALSGLKAPSTFATSLIKQVPNSTSKTYPLIQPKIELLAPGNGAKQKLRFQPQVNSKIQTDMTMKMGMSMSMGGQALPKINLPAYLMTIETQINKIEPNGDIHYQFGYSKIETQANPTVPKEVMQTMQKQLEQLKGIKGVVIIDNRGQTKKANLSLPPNLDPSIKQMMEQITSSLEQLSSPVPEEAIGVGAKWRVTTNPTVAGMNFSQTTTYELVSIKDNIATLNVSLEQQASPQILNVPGMPPGAKFNLKSHSATGTGQVIISLNSIVPTRSNLSMDGTTVMEMEQKGQVPTNMTSNVTTELSMESK